jgi:hypothetical protein
MDIKKHSLTIQYPDIGILHGYMPGAAAFDFSPGQAYSGFIFFQDDKVMKSFFVSGQNIAVVCFRFFAHLSS